MERLVEDIMKRQTGKFAPATEDEVKQLQELGQGHMPAKMLQFFTLAMPQEMVYFGDYKFYPLKSIIQENKDAVPGCYLYPHGFITFASTLNGDAVCVDTSNRFGHVYFCSHSMFSENEICFQADGKEVRLELNHDNIIKCSYDFDITFKSFIRQVKAGNFPAINIERHVSLKYKINEL